MQQGPFAPRALPRFLATTSLAAAVSSSADFPGDAGYTTDLLHRLLNGTRTVSPVARHVLVTVLPLTTPPECHAASVSSAACHVAFAPNQRARPPELFFCRGHHWVHVCCGPVTRSPSRRWLGRSASSASFPPRMRPKLRRFLTFPPVGLSPTEHVCLSWTHWFAKIPIAMRITSQHVAVADQMNCRPSDHLDGSCTTS